MASITDHWTDPFWTDFSNVPYSKNFTDSDDESTIFVCRTGFEIGVNLADQGCVRLELEDAQYLRGCLDKAIEDTKSARREAMRYFRETSEAELKKRQEALPDTIAGLQKDAAALAADLAALQVVSATGKDMAGAANGLTERAEVLKQKLNELRKTINCIRKEATCSSR